MINVKRLFIPNENRPKRYRGQIDDQIKVNQKDKYTFEYVGLKRLKRSDSDTQESQTIRDSISLFKKIEDPRNEEDKKS